MYPHVKRAVENGEVLLEWDYSKGKGEGGRGGEGGTTYLEGREGGEGGEGWVQKKRRYEGRRERKGGERGGDMNRREGKG